MTNPVRGEVGFKVGDTDYILVLDFNVLCDLEDDLPGIMDGKMEVKRPSIIRRIFHAGLMKHHAGLSERDAGDLIQAVGIAEAGALVGEAFKVSFPEAAVEGKARPRTS